ncbi:MAG: HAD-IA family hydrolase [Deltaproteobacteria bacterium]|nr:HAD-IA family hydrolase [Deltaproteobacteria bacterium]
MKVSFVWFDIGYTLLYMQRETTYQQALQEFGIDVPLADIEKEFHLTDKLFMRHYPGIFLKPREVYMPSYLGIINYRLGLSLNVCELDACWEEIKKNTKDYWRPFNGVKEVLSELKRCSIRMGVISNWDCTARDILTTAGLIDFFEQITISCEVNCNKPDRRIFNLALQKAAVAAHECIYVGDNYYDDAVGSLKVGMKALIINRFGTLGVEEIRNCNLISDISEVLNLINSSDKRMDSATG